MNKIPIKFLAGKQRKEILEKLQYYGITELPNYLLAESGKEKVRAYSGNLTMEQVQELDNEVWVEVLGMYLFHDYGDSIRLSFDAVQILKNQITKNTLDLDDKQAEEFLKGRDIALSKEEFENLKNKGQQTGFKVLKHKGDFLGSGKLTQEGRIVNYMPKERRLR